MDCARQRKPSRAAPTPEQVDAEVKQIDPRALKEFAEAAARYAKKNPWKPVHAANARGRLSRLLGSLGGANDAWKREADRLLVQQLHAVLRQRPSFRPRCPPRRECVAKTEGAECT